MSWRQWRNGCGATRSDRVVIRPSLDTELFGGRVISYREWRVVHKGTTLALYPKNPIEDITADVDARWPPRVGAGAWAWAWAHTRYSQNKSEFEHYHCLACDTNTLYRATRPRGFKTWVITCAICGHVAEQHDPDDRSLYIYAPDHILVSKATSYYPGR